MSISAFIVDDEPMARGNLVVSLQEHSGWSDLSTFSSCESLIANVIRQRPQVIFLDIQMPGDNGMSVARKILTLPHPPLIVFVTAHSEYAVAAFELYAIDYLLKPFSDERLAQCVAKLEYALNNELAYQRAHSAQTAWASDAPLKRLVIKSSASIRIVDVAEIQWIATNGNYVDVHGARDKHLLRASLKHLLSRLPQDDFIRVHRRYAVRFGLIREVKTKDNDRSVAVLASGEMVPVGKSFRRALLDRLCR